MKVLILTVTTGEGHNSAAAALECKLANQGVETKQVDAYYYVSNVLGSAIANGYLLSIGSMSNSYSLVYDILEHRKRSDASFSPTVFALRIIAKKLLGLINDYAPDVIVCTHVFAAMPVEILKEKGLITAKTFAIVTDFTVHPYWEELKSFDHIVLPSEQLEWQCLKKKLRPEQLLPSGIPIKDGFDFTVPKTEARKKLSLFPNVPVIMVMGGSMGYGNLYKIIKKIDNVQSFFQIVAICGNNNKAYKKLSESEFKHNIKILGFTNDIPLIMDAADCIVTKPGGITVSEALAKKLPLILTKPIPGHEERNMEFLINNGAAISVNNKTTIEESVWCILSSQERINLMSKAAELLGKPNSTKDLANFIIENRR